MDNSSSSPSSPSCSSSKSVSITELNKWPILSCIDKRHLQNVSLAFVHDDIVFLVNQNGEFNSFGRETLNCSSSDEYYISWAPKNIPVLNNAGIIDITVGTHKLGKSAQAYSIFALSSSGCLYSWGYNKTGSLGLGNIISPKAPTKVTFTSSSNNDEEDKDREVFIKTIVSGDGYTLALSKSGHVWGWGRNNKGQIGHNFKVNHTQPIKVAGLKHKISKIACGVNHSVVLSRDGVMYTFGCNTNGQLGIGTKEEYSMTPNKVKLPGHLRVKNICCGKYHTLALTVDGDLFAWGGGHYGELGIGDKHRCRAPVQVEFDNETEVLDIAALSNHCFSVCNSDLGVYMWGKVKEVSGKIVDVPWKTLMNNTTEILSSFIFPSFMSSPLTVDNLDEEHLEEPLPHPNSELMKHPGLKFIDPQFLANLRLAFVCGSGFEQTAILITSDDTVYFVGKNVHGSCGSGTEIISETSTPTKNDILSGKGITSFGFGLDPEGGCMCLFALTQQGHIYSWGYNDFGEMGTGEKSATPQIPQLIKGGGIEHVKIVQIAVGSDHTLALSEDGLLYAWGYNMYGQLGTGQLEDCDPVPKRVDFSGGPNTLISSIAAGMFHSVAVTIDGQVLVWGQNDDKNQLGRATDEPFSCSPLGLRMTESVAKVSCGPDFTLALTVKGTLYFWGLCKESGLKYEKPTRLYVNGDIEIVDIIAAHWGSAAGCETKDGEIYIWGKIAGRKVWEKPTLERRAKSVREVLSIFSSPWGMIEPIVIITQNL